MHGHYATGEIVMESSQEREVTLQAPCYIFTDNAVLVVSVAIIIATCAAILTGIKSLIKN